MKKLVRDKIPLLTGKTPIQTIHTPAYYRFKIAEESSELINSHTNDEFIEECADLLELMQAMCKHGGIPWSQVEQKRLTKRLEKGGFEEGYVLEFDK